MGFAHGLDVFQPFLRRLSSGSRWSEIFVETALELRADLIDGAPRVFLQEALGVAIRRRSDGSDLFASATIGTGDELDRLVAQLAGSGTADPDSPLPSHIVPPSWPEFDPSRLDGLVAGIDAVAAGFHAGLGDGGADGGRATVRVRDRRYAVLNSDGEGCDESALQVHLVAAASAGNATGHSGLARTAVCDLTTAAGHELGMQAALQASRLREAHRPTSGPRGVVFGPKPAGMLVHEVIGHGLESDAVMTRSALWNTRGSAFGPPGLQVVDDGRRPDAWERVAADEEATPLTETVLVADGHVVGALTDKVRARALGLPASGHGRRGGFANAPLPRVRPTVVAAGRDEPDAIVGDTGDGILVHAVDSGEATVRDGRFTIKVLEAQEITGGRLGRRLTDFTITGDLDAFQRVDGIGHDVTPYHALCGRGMNWLPISGEAPTLRLMDVMIHGRVA